MRVTPTTIIVVGVAAYIAYRYVRRVQGIPVDYGAFRAGSTITRDGKTVGTVVADFREVSVTNPYDVSARVMRNLTTGAIKVVPLGNSTTADSQQIGALRARETKVYRVRT